MIGPSPTLQEAFSKVDACPSCVQNVEAPYGAHPTSAGYRCLYRCTSCGHTWSTSWIAEVA